QGWRAAARAVILARIARARKARATTGVCARAAPMRAMTIASRRRIKCDGAHIHLGGERASGRREGSCTMTTNYERGEAERAEDERVRTVDRKVELAIAAIDAQMSAQLAEVMHHPRFLELEGTWRGLAYLAKLRETGRSLNAIVRVMNVSKQALAVDLAEN